MADPAAELASEAAASAAADPHCFDATQSGASLWVVARSAERSVQVVHVPQGAAAGSNSRRRTKGRGSRGSRGSSSSTQHELLLPEPVAAVQLGVPTDLAAAAAGTAVLVVVGSSCRVWAFQLQSYTAAVNAAAPSGDGGPPQFTASSSAGVLVPVSQQQCQARHVLAAAVAWEHLCCCWDSHGAGGVADNSSGSGSTAAGNISIAVLGLHKLLASLQRIQQQQQPLLVHSVASLVCQPEAAAGQASGAPAIPPDAVAAAVVSLADPGTLQCSSGSNSGSAGSMLPRVRCRSRHEVPASCASVSSSGSPVGYLVLSTASGLVQALPLGTPYGSGSGMQGLATDRPAGTLPLAACFGGSSLCFVPAPMNGASSGNGEQAMPQPQLLLCAESGRLMEAAAAGLAGIQPILMSAGSSAGGLGSGGVRGGGRGSGQAAYPFAATVQMMGVQAAAAAGSCLWYLQLHGASEGSSSSSSGGSSGMLCCLDAGNALAAADRASPDAAVAAAAEVVIPSAKAPVMALAAACIGSPPGTLAGQAQSQGQQKQQQQQTLVMLKSGGAVHAVVLPSSGCVPDTLQRHSVKRASIQQLERNTQGLLGRIAEVSAQQEQLQKELVQLDGSIASLAAAIPTAQAITGGSALAPTVPAAAGRLHCTVRPLALRSRGVGCSLRPSSGIASSSSSSSWGPVWEDELSVEVSLHNSSRLALSGSWSLLLSFSESGNGGRNGSRNSSDSSSSTVLAAPLGCELSHGADWRHEFWVPLAAAGAAGCLGGKLQVALCRPSSSGHTSSSSSSSSSSNSGGSGASCMLLLHSIELDALDILHLRDGGSTSSKQWRQQAAPLASSSSAAGQLQASVLLQMPIFPGRAAPPQSGADLLQQLLRQGRSTKQQKPAGEQQPAAAGRPAAAFSLLLPAPLPEAQHSSSSISGQLPCAAAADGLAHLSTQVVPAAGAAWTSSSPQYCQQVQITAGVHDPATLLACHAAICRRSLLLQESASDRQQLGPGLGAQTQLPWPQLPNGSTVLLPPAASYGADVAAACRAAIFPGATEASLEQAVLLLRQVKAAAMSIRDAATASMQHDVRSATDREPNDLQVLRRQQLSQLQQLVLDARRAVGHVPFTV